MIHSTKEFRREVKNIFVTIKLLVLFFCVIPVIQDIFMTNENEEILFYNISKMLTFIVIIVLVGVFWFIINYAFKNNRVQKFIEILVIYSMGMLCYINTGLNESNYKFTFALMVLIYSMEFGLKFGTAFAIFSGSVVIVCDVIACEEKMRSTYFQSDFMLLGTLCLIAYIVGFYVEKDRKLIAALNDSANRDSLTGLFNHRYFHEHMHEVMQSTGHESEEFLLMMDIDYFKVYNDTLGHQKGDVVLKTIAEICEANVLNGSVFRYGGEEFVIYMQAKSLDEVMRIANLIRLAVADHHFEGETLMPGHDLTVSIGVSGRRSNDDTAADWIERADNALYKAKAFRKNRVQAYSSVFERFDHLDQINDDASFGYQLSRQIYL